MRSAAAACACAGLLACSFDPSGIAPQGSASADAAVPADAAAPPLVLGDGSDGALTVASDGVVVNAATPITTAGELTVDVVDAAIVAPGDLVMLWQTTGTSERAAGDTSAVELEAGGVGHFELATVAAVRAGAVMVVEPLAHRYGAGAQLVRVPQYTDVDINAGGRLTATAWDGQSGGVVAFVASGTVTLRGAIDATGLGFRGGPSAVGPLQRDCAALEEPGPGGGRAGEAVIGPFDESATGYGNRGNGGGGGNCSDAGGGGGGHARAGGRGGDSVALFGRSRVGGRGGAALRYAADTHLSFGGGGGAGHINTTDDSSGGSGGGVIWIRGRSIAGAGMIRADGVDGAASSDNNGAGGGGAGGVIDLAVATSMSCGLLSASGGAGGNTAAEHGPGGGGGPGVIELSPATCAARAEAGATGVAGGDAWGAGHGCGDAVVEGDETCDDENLVAGDGCNEVCQLEPGWRCDGSPSRCSRCGNGELDAGESCDDGNRDDGDGCNALCMVEPGATCTARNAVRNGGFTDGNTGFTTDAIFIPAPRGNPFGCADTGHYAIRGDGSFAGGFPAIDVSPTEDNLSLQFDAATEPGLRLWQQTVELVPSTDYVLYFFAARDGGIAPRLTVEVDGEVLGAPYEVTDGDWQKVRHRFRSSALGGAATITIRNQRAGCLGNNPALDEIWLQPAASPSGPPTPAAFECQ